VIDPIVLFFQLLGVDDRLEGTGELTFVVRIGTSADGVKESLFKSHPCPNTLQNEPSRKQHSWLPSQLRAAKDEIRRHKLTIKTCCYFYVPRNNSDKHNHGHCCSCFYISWGMSRGRPRLSPMSLIQRVYRVVRMER